MWICLNNAFLSIVDKAKDDRNLMVRARRRGDIERVFPDAKVIRTIGNDYLFRAEIDREIVAETISDLICQINYDNFKSSVTDDKLHTAYVGVWREMSRIQPIPPYSRGRGRQGTLV